MTLPMNELNIDYRGKLVFKSMSEDFPVEARPVDLNRILVQWHWHDSFELGIVRKGRVEINVELVTHTVSEGDVFLVKPEIIHSLTPVDSGPHELLVIQFLPEVIGGRSSSIFWKKYLTPLMNDPSRKVLVLKEEIPWQDEVRSLISNVFSETESRPDGYEFTVRSDLSRIFYLCVSHDEDNDRNETEKSRRDAARLMKMLNYIAHHYSEDITTEMIAQSAMISESECQRCFKRLAKTTPIKYLRKFRIQRSLALLADRSLKISDIAMQCGFKEISYYSSMFKKLYGTTPGEYRNSL